MPPLTTCMCSSITKSTLIVLLASGVIAEMTEAANLALKVANLVSLFDLCLQAFFLFQSCQPCGRNTKLLLKDLTLRRLFSYSEADGWDLRH
jgi:hypothetical protein